MRGRHRAAIFAFFLLVVVPASVVAWYLWFVAEDQYASTVGFSVRTEEVSGGLDLLGGITELSSGASSSDTDILYEFIQSQKLVAKIDDEFDLRAIWTRPENDPFFTLLNTETIEDLVDHWGRMVRIHYDAGSGLIEVRALAFRPEDATIITQAILDESSAMINALSAIAREDAIRYSREELESAIERLKLARAAVTRFRNANQIVDPSVDVEVQAGLLGSLQAQLAEALIAHAVLVETLRDGDPRISTAERQVRVIREQIAVEKRKLGLGDSEVAGGAIADIVGEFESLMVDREFAERSYIAALADYDAALVEARRQSRYLAAYILPTQAEKSEYPQRFVLFGVITLFLFLFWAILVLVLYALRDRR